MKVKAYERYSYGTIDFRGAFGADMTHWPSAWRDNAGWAVNVTPEFSLTIDGNHSVWCLCARAALQLPSAHTVQRDEYARNKRR
jgi:hypothetical protein